MITTNQDRPTRSLRSPCTRISWMKCQRIGFPHLCAGVLVCGFVDRKWTEKPQGRNVSTFSYTHTSLSLYLPFKETSTYRPTHRDKYIRPQYTTLRATLRRRPPTESLSLEMHNHEGPLPLTNASTLDPQRPSARVSQKHNWVHAEEIEKVEMNDEWQWESCGNLCSEESLDEEKSCHSHTHP